MAATSYSGDPILVYSTHIATPSLGLLARMERVEAILDHADQVDLPTVIGGDLNTADPGSADQIRELFIERGYQSELGATGGSTLLGRRGADRLAGSHG